MSFYLRVCLTVQIIVFTVLYGFIVLNKAQSDALFIVTFAVFAAVASLVAFWRRAESRAALRRVPLISRGAIFLNISVIVVNVLTFQHLGWGIVFVMCTPFIAGAGASFAPPYIKKYGDVYDETQHYALYKEEIDALQKEYERILIEKYDLKETYLYKLKQERDAKQPAPVVIRGHFDETPAEQLATSFFDDLYLSANANNPEIFSAHVATREPLPPGYNYSSIAQKIGKTLQMRIDHTILIALTCVTVYSFFFSRMVISSNWYKLSFVLGIAYVVIMALWSRFSTAPGRYRYGLRRLDQGQCFRLLSFPCTVIGVWFMLMHSVGYLGTVTLGARWVQVLPYSKHITTQACNAYALHIEDNLVGNSRPFCVSKETFERMPQRGIGLFMGQTSWFGINLQKVDPGGEPALTIKRVIDYIFYGK